MNLVYTLAPYLFQTNHIYFFIIIIIISGSTVLVRTLAASLTGGFLILLRHAIGLLWTSDWPVSKACT
jgi:hypothetical protein